MSYQYESTIICPYCDHDHKEWWEFGVEEGEREINCDNCGKNFAVDTNISYTFSTRKVDCEVCDFEDEHIYNDVNQETCDRWNREKFTDRDDHVPYISYIKKCKLCDNSEYRKVLKR